MVKLQRAGWNLSRVLNFGYWRALLLFRGSKTAQINEENLTQSNFRFSPIRFCSSGWPKSWSYATICSWVVQFNNHWRGRLSTTDLLVLTSLDQLRFILSTLLVYDPNEEANRTQPFPISWCSPVALVSTPWSSAQRKSNNARFWL